MFTLIGVQGDIIAPPAGTLSDRFGKNPILYVAWCVCVCVVSLAMPLMALSADTVQTMQKKGKGEKIPRPPAPPKDFAPSRAAAHHPNPRKALLTDEASLQTNLC